MAHFGKMKSREKFIKCSCHGEGMLLTKFDDEEELYVSFWREGINPVKLTWWMRLKLCYLALFKGNYYEDQLILSKEEAMKLSLWIQNEHDHVTEWVGKWKKMKITIEPSKDQRGETYPYSKVSVEYPHDDVDIETMMGEVVKVVQAWGFDNTNIAEYLDEEFAEQRGLIPVEIDGIKKKKCGTIES